MDDEMKELKSLLRSLVVSSPTQMDVRSLLRDYRNMVGAPVPLAKYGHRDPVAFLKERFSDCFVMTGPSSNPVLTLIVPDTLKHIDQFVQRQKVPSTAKFKSKRRSIPEPVVKLPKQDQIVKKSVKDTPPVIVEPEQAEVKASVIVPVSSQNKENVNQQATSTDVKNFLKKRLPLYNSVQNFEELSSEKGLAISLCQDDDSGKHTSSSNSSTKALQLEELKSDIMELIGAAPGGVWCTDLIRLYRERFNREINFTRFGYTSIISLVYALEERVVITRPEDTGDWRLQPRGAGPAAPAAPPPAPRPRPARAPARAPPDPDDALPGIDFDADVFPADCVHFMESIPAVSLREVRPGAMLEVIVGEVYSPSHFWLIRLGDQYNIAMEEMMDEMTHYYNGEGRGRTLARGAVRVGHYCSSLYERDWHRSLIVKIIDSDTVKVRHVDYGTVDTVAARALRPLRRQWARLPAQAARARLAGVRPCAAGRRWPPAAAAAFLRLVRDTRLVANVVAVDPEEDVIETLLIDTSGAEDRCLSADLIRTGHADARPDSALRTAECYLYPRFEALESGATPNLEEIHAYLRDGIALDYVDAYRQHVPACLPPDTAPAPPPALSRPPSADTLHGLYDVSRDSSASDDPAERPTRIPLWLPTSEFSFPCPSSLSKISPPETTPGCSPSPPAAPPPAARASRPSDAPAPCGRSHSAIDVQLDVHQQPSVSIPPDDHHQASQAECRPQSVVHPQPAGLAPPRPYPAGLAPRSPWDGPAWLGPGWLALSPAESDTYRMLAHVNPEAAHWYMVGALGRAVGPPRWPPPRWPPPHAPPVRAPPGFGM